MAVTVRCEKWNFFSLFCGYFIGCEKAESDLSRSLTIAPREKSDSAFLYVYEIMKQKIAIYTILLHKFKSNARETWCVILVSES